MKLFDVIVRGKCESSRNQIFMSIVLSLCWTFFTLWRIGQGGFDWVAGCFIFLAIWRFVEFAKALIQYSEELSGRTVKSQPKGAK